MAHFKIFALENTRARLCVSQTSTDDKNMAEYVIAAYKRAGRIVNVDVEPNKSSSFQILDTDADKFLDAMYNID